MIANREFVFLTSAAVNDSESARAASRSRSVAKGGTQRKDDDEIIFLLNMKGVGK